MVWPIGDSSSWPFLFLRCPIILQVFPNWLAHDIEGLSFLFCLQSSNQSLSSMACCLTQEHVSGSQVCCFLLQCQHFKVLSVIRGRKSYIPYILSPLSSLSLFGSLSKFIQILLILVQYPTKEDAFSLPHVLDGFLCDLLPSI